MKLSVIIVNYNVRHYLENCLHSVVKACEGLSAEIIVVDNASVDDSPSMMAELFPQITYHYLNENVGFSKGNNYGIERSHGEYALLLNPDTLVQEDTFKKCIDFMDAHQNAGALGVKMIDGNGLFLPESKRGLPTPSVAFFKIFGLSALFPKSTTFGKYHLGFLAEHEIHSVEVLSGAFMLIRKKVLDQIGYLDEGFFMYGEDIDLSYRIIKAGYKNYYFPDTQIIHYKGESTKKGSVNYVFVFYRAMVIFVRKHFKKNQASLFGLLINMAIYFRASLSVLSRVFNSGGQSIIDFLLIYGLFSLTSNAYAAYTQKDFTLPFIAIAVPAYALTLVLSLFFTGAYDKPFRLRKYFSGWGIGVIILLAAYALLPENYRFSRAVLLFGGLFSLLTGIFWRLLFRSFRNQITSHAFQPNRKIIAGNSVEIEATKILLKKCGVDTEFMVGVSESDMNSNEIVVGKYDQLKSAIRSFQINEVLFSIASTEFSLIIHQHMALADKGVQFKVVNTNSNFILGPSEIHRIPRYLSGASLTNLNLSGIKRNKRTFDLVFSFVTFAFSPILLFFVDRKIGLIQNSYKVMIGKASWVKLDPRSDRHDMPKLKQGIIHPMMHIIWPEGMTKEAYDVNVDYLVAYNFWSDFQHVWRHMPNLGDKLSG